MPNKHGHDLAGAPHHDGTGQMATLFPPTPLLHVCLHCCLHCCSPVVCVHSWLPKPQQARRTPASRFVYFSRPDKDLPIIRPGSECVIQALSTYFASVVREMHPLLQAPSLGAHRRLIGPLSTSPELNRYIQILAPTSAINAPGVLNPWGPCRSARLE